MSATGQYAPTLHWGMAREGFDSVVTIYNYLGFAFRDEPPERTDAVVEIKLYDQEGAAAGEHTAEVTTGGTLHVPVSRIRSDFQGAVTVAMRPKGRMGRLSAREGATQRPIATSFFMLYRREDFADFSHELFIVREKPQTSPTEWATVLFTERSLDAAIIVMNNRIGSKASEDGSDVEVKLFNLAGDAVSDSYRFSLAPAGSRIVRLSDAFPTRPEQRTIATVTGRNIEQPMSLHLHAGGDFNIHHF